MVSTRWPDGGVVTQRTANPCTPVRFRLGPPPPCLSDRVPRGYPFNLLTMRTGLADLPCPLSCWSASIAWSASTFFCASLDRKSVVSGKRVSVRVDLGGCRIMKKKNKEHTNKCKHDTIVDT